ncbi:MAG: heme exporter protein CcmB [Cystobacterineae bacterium]|nr:heme exporter protein CcmB [Cystobacterineae bacterium]
MKTGFLHNMWAVLLKDFQIEWKTKARLNALLFFSIATLLMFSFAVGPNVESKAAHAAAYIWLSLLFASVLSLGESFRIESENHALEGLRLAPTSLKAFFLGKTIANTLLLWLLSLLIVPLTFALYNVELQGSWVLLVLVLLGGAAAIAAPGTFYAAIALGARSKDILLPLLMFPVLVPALVACVKATTLVVEADPMQQLSSWLALLTAFCLVYWVLGTLLFPHVVEGD